MFEGPLPEGPVRSFPLYLHRVRSNSPMVIMDLHFRRFATPGNRRPFYFRITIRPVVRMSRRVSFPNPGFPARPTNLGYPHRAVNHGGQPRIFRLVRSYVFFLTSLVMSVHFCPLRTGVPVARLPRDNVTTVVTHEPDGVFQGGVSRPPTRRKVMSCQLYRRGPFFSFRAGRVTQLPYNFGHRRRAARRGGRRRFLRACLVIEWV